MYNYGEYNPKNNKKTFSIKMIEYVGCQNPKSM